MDLHVDLYTNQFWDGVRARLAPLLGDLAVSLGEDWMDDFEELFSRGDFLTVRASRWNKGQPPIWTRVTLLYENLPDGAAGRFDADFITAARSEGQALAWLVGRCSDAGIWPEGILHEGHDWVFLRGGVPFARIGSAQISQASESDRKRAMGTLTKTRAHSDPEGELRKRFSRWPRVGGLEVTGPQLPGEEGRALPHLPIPSEWLISAHELCRRTGQTQPSHALCQAVASAALGAESWNHIAGPLDIQACQAYCPWLLASEETEYGLFSDPFAAFPALVRLGEEWAAGAAYSFNPYSWSSPSRLPCYVFSKERPADGGQESAFLRMPANLRLDPVETCVLEDRDEQKLALKLGSAAALGQVDVLERAFRIGDSRVDRVSKIELDHGETFIVAEGAYRFTVDDIYLRAARYDGSGNRTWQVAAARHKAALFRHASGLYVLTGEYQLDKPLAIFPPLSENTVATIATYLGLEQKQSLHPERYCSWLGGPVDGEIHRAAAAMSRGEQIDLTKAKLK